MKKILNRALLALACAGFAAAAQAQIASTGPYLVAAVGGAKYDYDCYFFSSCNAGHATTVKLGGGYRFGVFAVEGWWTDYGKASIDAPPDGSLRVRSAGLAGAWYLRLGPTVQGLLRAGGANTWHARTDDTTTSKIDATIGLGLLVDLTPTAAAELAWDLTTAEGRNTGSVLAIALTAGLRLRF